VGGKVIIVTAEVLLVLGIINTIAFKIDLDEDDVVKLFYHIPPEDLIKVGYQTSPTEYAKEKKTSKPFNYNTFPFGFQYCLEC
jgi:hypothetical protein